MEKKIKMIREDKKEFDHPDRFYSPALMYREDTPDVKPSSKGKMVKAVEDRLVCGSGEELFQL